MSKPNTELLEAIKRFEDSSMPDIIVVSLKWPQFALYLDALRELTHRRKNFAFSEIIEAEVSRGWNVARSLRTSLIHPTDSSLGLTDIDSWPAPLSGDLGQLQAALRAAAHQLLTTTNPGIGAIQAMLSQQGGIRWPAQGTARVVVPNAAIAGTQAALASVETPPTVQWDVCNVSQARQKDSCAITLLPGSPEISVDWRVPAQLRSKMVSWLFNAPMSGHVILLRWPGSIDFDSSNYEPGRNSQVLDPRITGERDLGHSTSVDEEFSVPFSTPPSRQLGHGGEPVESLDFQLPDGHWISYGIEHGPSALRIDEDSEFETDIETRLKAKNLRRGNTLVILESTAGRTLRRSLCYQWISERQLGFNPDEAQRAVDAYKSSIRAMSSRDLIPLLKGRGLAEDYARNQVNRAHDPSTIAPEQRQNLEAIARATGFDPPEQMWDYIKALRGGYMHAGRVIKDQLKDVVTADASWQDTVAARRIARLEIPNLGVIWLAPILGVSEETGLRHLGELGELVKV